MWHELVAFPEFMIAWGMFGFLIKKAFFDMWDNLLGIIILNLGFLLPGAIVAFSMNWLNQGRLILGYLTLGSGLAVLFVYSGVVSSMTSMIADYKRPGIGDFLPALKATYPSSLLFALLNFAVVALSQLAFRFYGGLESFVGPLASSFIFWILLFWILATQYFYSIQARLDKKFRKIIRKMFLLLLDNPLFTVGLFIGTVLSFVLSFINAFLILGLASILLWWNVALKLRLYKYDYLEEHPEARRNIPWDALLVEDRERVGKRTLRGMIFPWKE
jgi:hypothetical protein